MTHRSHVFRAELFERGLGRWLWCSDLSDVCFEPNKKIKYSALPKFTVACWYGGSKVRVVSAVFLRLNIVQDLCPCDVVWEEKCRIFFKVFRVVKYSRVKSTSTSKAKYYVCGDFGCFRDILFSG